MIATWLAELPALVIAISLLVVPGLAAAFLLRLRGVVLAAGTVAISLASIGAASLFAPLVGLSWSLLPVLIVAALVTGIAGVLWLVRRPSAAPISVLAAPRVWLGLGVAALGWILVLSVGISAPDHPTQLYDGIFHLNAVEFILQTGDASPFHMTMVVPGATSNFYPTLWHALVALVEPFSGGIVAATNVMTIASIVVVWPLGLAALTAVLFPQRPTATMWAPLVAFGFSVFPLGFLNWGVLYPNLIGTLQIPLVLTFVILALERDVRWAQRLGLVLTAIAAMGATALGHPSALLGAVALLVPFVAYQAWTFARDAGTRTRVVVGVFGMIVTISLALVWHAANVTTHEWLPSLTMGQALGEVALLSPVGRATGLLVGPLAIVGFWVIARERMWWILGTHAVASGLFLVSTWLPALSLRSTIVGVWYDDTTRVAALLAMIGLPAAALGAAEVGVWIGSLRRGTRRLAGGALIALVALLAATHLNPLLNDVKFMRNVSFRFDVHSQGLSKAEAALFRQASQLLGPDALVIGDPLTGAALLYAYTGNEVVFPHVTGKYGADAQLLARSLRDAPTPEVCGAIDRLGVTHVLDFGDRELFENHYTTYDGLHDLSTSTALTEVARVGEEARLYEVSGCG